MARATVEDVVGVGPFSQMYRWRLSFDTFPAALGGSLGGFTSDDMYIRCESTEIPRMIEIAPTRVELHGHEIEQPGKYAPAGPIIFTFVETDDRAISKGIKAWRDIIWEPRTGKSLPTDQLTAVIRIEEHDVEDNAVFEYVMYGCYLKEYDAGGNLDGTTADSRKPTMSIRYTWFEDREL